MQAVSRIFNAKERSVQGEHNEVAMYPRCIVLLTTKLGFNIAGLVYALFILIRHIFISPFCLHHVEDKACPLIVCLNTCRASAG